MRDFRRVFPGMAVGLASAVLAVLVSAGIRAAAQPSPRAEPPVVEVRAVGLQFQAPERVRSGWTTFRFINQSPMTHFALFERLPPGIGVKEQQREMAPVFQAGMDLLRAGEKERAAKKFAELPAWMADIVFMGGPGLLAPGRTSETTVHLDPGTYLIECYVKTDGLFHSYNPKPGAFGMVRELVVTKESTGASPPAPDIELTISRKGGIGVSGDIGPGRRTVAVRFEDQSPHENFVGHDVHLVRLREETSLEALGAWMDWTRPEGLETPAPFEFLGGTNEMPAGATAYFSVELTAGRYAWIAEVPNPAEKSMLRAFTVGAGGSR